MKKVLGWGLALLMILAMVLVFAGGCAPAADLEEEDDDGFEEWEDYIDDLDIDFEEDFEDGADFEEEAEDGVDVE